MTDGRTDDVLLTFGQPVSATTVGPYRYDGQVAVVTRGVSDELEKLFVYGGTFLADPVRVLVTHLDGNESFEAVYSDHTVAAYGDIRSEVTLYAPRAEHVTLNGVPWPFSRSGDYIVIGGAKPLYLPVIINGPTTGSTNTSHTFTATVGPITATQPITYVWRATDLGTVTHAGEDLDDTAAFAWTMPGSKAITVTAANAASTVSGTHVITLTVDPVAPVCLSVSGLTAGVVGMLYVLTATVSPFTTTRPITYVWHATDLGTVTRTVRGLDDTASFLWTIPGVKTIHVAAVNAGGSVASGPYTMTISGRVYLPVVLKQE